jgi:hypothetical protein
VPAAIAEHRYYASSDVVNRSITFVRVNESPMNIDANAEFAFAANLRINGLREPLRKERPKLQRIPRQLCLYEEVAQVN